MVEEHIQNMQFEKEWESLALAICHDIYSNPLIQGLKKNLAEKGFLTLEEQSLFIDISDSTKYNRIYEKYGKEGTEGYKKFSEDWQKWFKGKGVSSEQHRRQRNSMDHILFGSTPDPMDFLLNFEKECFNDDGTPCLVPKK